VIKNKKVPVCLLTVSDKQKSLIQVFPQSTCPHSKLGSVNEFVLGGKKNLKNFGSSEDSHVNTIEEFFEKFMRLDQIVSSIEEEDDNYNIANSLFDYLAIVKELVKKDLDNEDQIEMVIEEIEKHITSSMFNCIFPKFASEADQKLYFRTVEHEWVKPEHLDIVPANRNEAMWKFAIGALKNVEVYRSPADKLNCFVECMSIIVNVLSLMSSTGAGVGTDDSLPLIIYIVLKAQPKRFFSNLNYVLKYRHQSKMIGLKGFVFQQFQSAASFIEGLNEKCLTIDKAEYIRLIDTSRERMEVDKEFN